MSVTPIKFGTDGWRAIIAQEYTVDNVKRVAEATGNWVKNNNGNSIVIGYDCRFAGKLFADTTARVLGAQGIKVKLDPNFSSTPMVSLGVVKLDCDLGVVITASHNPPSYNGFKLKSKLGGPMIQAQINEVEALIPDVCTLELPSLESLAKQGLYEEVDLEQIYYDHVMANFDVDAILNADFGIAYDGMYGAGQNIVKRVLPGTACLHCEYNPSFHGQAPEPIDRNLKELSALIAGAPGIKVGFANDGDADRIGMYDEDGKFVDSHHLLLLLLMYMKEYKNETGKVVITFSVTEKMKDLAEQYGLDYEVTKIGFKYIAEIMGREDVLVGGEESGGLAVKGHIPERDGVWMALLVLELMAKSGKSLKELIQDIYAKVGSFSFDRDDLHLTNEKKLSIVNTCKTTPYKSFGKYQVTDFETIDGYKYYLRYWMWYKLLSCKVISI